MAWTTVADVRARVQRRWDDSSLLRSYAAGQPFPRVEVPLRGPRPVEMGERLAEVQAWVAALSSGSRQGTRYSLELSEVGGRLIGRNQVPSRAVIESYDQAWALLGVRADVSVLDEILSIVEAEPWVQAWVLQQPRRAIEQRGRLERLVAAARWLDAERESGRYLREISAPGVDTKFAEQNREVLAQILRVPASARGFLTGLGLRTKPEFTRMRPDPGLGLLHGITEISLRHDELPRLELQVRRALIVENEVTYLSVPIPPEGVVLWGRGFDVDRAGSLPWLGGAAVTYWGDLDTHGFAILNRLRAWLPQSRSVLMDLDTLLAHRDRWGTEDSPTAARLDRLTPRERDVYLDLVEDRHGTRIRLEQERIDWAWALRQLA